jgi:hypothetical protein
MAAFPQRLILKGKSEVSGEFLLPEWMGQREALKVLQADVLNCALVEPKAWKLTA